MGKKFVPEGLVKEQVLKELEQAKKIPPEKGLRRCVYLSDFEISYLINVVVNSR